MTNRYAIEFYNLAVRNDIRPDSRPEFDRTVGGLERLSAKSSSHMANRMIYIEPRVWQSCAASHLTLKTLPGAAYAFPTATATATAPQPRRRSRAMNSVHNSAIRVAEHGLGIGSVPIKHHHKAPLLPGFGGGFVNHGRSSLGVMAIFAVIPTPTPAPPKLMAALAEHFKETHVVIDGGHGWLIAGRLYRQRSIRSAGDHRWNQRTCSHLRGCLVFR